MELKEITTKAEQLATIRKDIDAIEMELKVKTEQLKFRRDRIQLELIDALKDSGLKSIKVASGENYAMATRKSLDIIDIDKALVWATKNNAISIDKRIAGSMLKDVEKLPSGFELKTTDFISIRKPKKNE